MKLNSATPAARSRGFTLVEVMITMTILVSVLGMCMSSFLFGLRAMYKDTERLKTNASLRTFMAQISKETLDASYFYLFPYYTAIDANVNLATDVVSMAQIEDAADNDYDKWVGQGDCLVLVTKTSVHRSTDIRQIRIYYRVVTNQTGRNQESVLRYIETADWGEGTDTNSNGRTSVATELNAINLNANPTPPTSSRVKVIALRTKGRAVASPYTPYSAGDRYPIFSSESPDSTSTSGFVAINVEFINGNSTSNLLSSSSFNYTISPRR